MTISGNLTRAAELRCSQSDTAVLRFSVAVNDRRKNPQTGEWEDCPNFVDCTMFGARAEKLHQFLAKGTKVAVDGKLRYSSWEGEGGRRSKLEVIVDELEFMSTRQRDQEPSYVPGARPVVGTAAADAPYAAMPELWPAAYGEDLPF